MVYKQNDGSFVWTNQIYIYIYRSLYMKTRMIFGHHSCRHDVGIISQDDDRMQAGLTRPRSCGAHGSHWLPKVAHGMGVAHATGMCNEVELNGPS